MTASRLLFPAAAAALALTACDARFGNDVAPGGNGSAENKAEEGQVSISAPGVEMKIDVPEGLRQEMRMNDDSGLIYPGSRMSGVHVEGGREKGRSDGEVELRFNSADAPDVVARWYRDPARAADFTIATATREGPAYLFAGTNKDGDGRFRIRLTPRAGGGTDGRVLLSDAE
ncbi:MAG TPA: hypothetical protein VGW40_13955 [Allosphingosinicella sp.]|nr:hypothetical protein [Allosphingosinicella sp.]